METNLRPLTLGEILDRTAQLYRENFLLFAGIFSFYAGVALAINLIQIGLGAWMQFTHAAAKLSGMIMVLGGVELIVLLLLLGAAIAAINRAVAWVHLGQPATIRGAYASTLPHFGRYLWLMTLTGVMAWLPAILLYGGYLAFILVYVRPRGLLAHGATIAEPGSATIFFVISGIFFLLLVPAAIYGLIMSLRYALAVPACVVENLKAWKAISRSVELSKGARGRIFILLLLVGAVKIGLVLVTQMFFIAAVYKNHGTLPPWLNAISQVVAFFTNSFVGPIGAAGIALFYYDQRVRKEGYDIERMMHGAGLGSLPPQDPSAGPSNPGALAAGDAGLGASSAIAGLGTTHE